MASASSGAAPPAQLLLATRNHGKVRELKQLLARQGIAVMALTDLPQLPEVIEDGATFGENARKKAREISRAAALPVLADDSGLEVDALGGAPGVHSARYAGTGHDDRANNALLLRGLAGVPAARRTARFRCAMALADVYGAMGERVLVREGSCEGVMLEAPRGDGGFGYDPLFFYPPLGRSFAELDAAEKSRVSHRARAMAAMLPLLTRYLGGEPPE